MRGMTEISKVRQNGVGLPVGIRRRAAVRPSLVARAARAADGFVTRVQERLERDDTAGQKILAYAVVAMTAVYFVGAVIIWIG